MYEKLSPTGIKEDFLEEGMLPSGCWRNWEELVTVAPEAR
jgi:hypothetical protein